MIFTKERLLRIFKPRTRLIISIVVAGLVYSLLPKKSLLITTSILLAWNSGVICFLVLIFSNMLGATHEKMRKRANREDEGRLAIFTLVVAVACASLFAIVYMLKDTKGLPQSLLILHVLLAGMTVICSWLLMHTMFALEYAHYYYQNSNINNLNNESVFGLDFPHEKQPDYWDFMYFSFVIGMTCQVSDVQVCSRAMRRLALIHGILTFFFNTVILALSINAIAGII